MIPKGFVFKVRPGSIGSDFRYAHCVSGKGNERLSSMKKGVKVLAHVSAHRIQVALCPHGINAASFGWSKQTAHVLGSRTSASTRLRSAEVPPNGIGSAGTRSGGTT